MSNWKTNAIMLWSGNMITDHGRQPLTEKIERIGTDKRMANGTLRRFYVGIKRSWDVTWQNIPSTNTVTGGYSTADGGYSGEQIQAFYNANQGKFRLVLKRGSAIGLSTPNPAESALPYQDQNFYICNVMFTDFSKDVVRRGSVDFWNITLTMEEV
jgi:hypothetical protein